MASPRLWTAVALPAFCLAVSSTAFAQARFDLAGPKIDIRVTRGNMTLPIAAVPNLQAGDRLWIHPDFPPSQSVHYLLIAAFLRGTTNPPPDDWFTRIETWQRRVREEGVSLTVPPEAEQALLFLAPETGGDFSTLRSAVKGRPGTFVRASQDLTEAGFEQARIEKYLAGIKLVPPGDPADLKQHSDLLARTLNLRPNPDCFKKSPDQQYACLTQSGTQMLLDDGHGQTLAAALSNGPASDFINAASYTNLAGGGNYSAYVGAVVDLIRLTSTLHTAQYQYIPAIAFPSATLTGAPSETLNLRLNMPPSFHNPKSVIVIGLPGVGKTVLPPLRPADPKRISCLLDPHMVLPIEGAPLVFSTSFAHDLVLRLNLPVSKPSSVPLDLPMVPDAYRGGLALDPNPFPRKELSLTSNNNSSTSLPRPAQAAQSSGKADPASGEPITGTVQGFWGFDPYIGPVLPIQNVPGAGWRIVGSPDSPAALIVGEPNHLQLTAGGTACVQTIAIEPSGDKSDKLEWKPVAPPIAPETSLASDTPPPPAPKSLVRPIDVTVNLAKAAIPGSLHLAIQQFGQKNPDRLAVKTFAEPARIDALRLYAGDLTATLTGSSLDQVKDLAFSLNGKELTYKPSSSSGDSILTLSLSADGKPPSLKPTDKISVDIHLKDGLILHASTLVLPARPAVTLLSRRVVQTSPSAIQLASPDDLPLGAQLTFFLKSKEKFPRDEEIEISSNESPDANSQTGSQTGSQTDPPIKTSLSIAAGTLTLQDSHTVVATFDPLKTFGPSTFGPFRLRAVFADGTHGEWIPLAVIVRLPTLTALRCPAAVAETCELDGSSLYLIDAVAPDLAFTAPVAVPEGFVDTTLSIPHPATLAKPHTGPATFYIRLHDDPSTTDAVTLPVQSEPSAAAARPKLPMPLPANAPSSR